MRAGRLALTLLFAPLLAAEEPATPGFGPGLQQLAGLGLPDMKGATWVRPPKDAEDSFARSYEFRELGVRMQGGAWKLPGDPPRRIGFATGSPLEGEEAPATTPPPEPPAEPGILGKMLRKHAASQAPKPATPKPGPSLDEDVKALLAALAKPAVIEELSEQAEYGRAELPGRLLIFAAQLHAAGHADHANRLAAALFAAIPGKTVVIDAAVHHFAETEFKRLSDTFFTDADWKSYQSGLRALLAKYPRGWADGPAVALLLPAVDKRVAGEKPATPALPDHTLTPDALAALDQLLATPTSAGGGQDDEAFARSQGMDLSKFPASQRAMILAQLRAQASGGSFDPGLWLLPGDPPEGPGGPLQQLTAMGMDGLLALAAVATDDTLTHSRNANQGGSSYFSNHESAEAITARRYRDLDRPKSRGEIARALLAATLPDNSDDSDAELDGTLLRDSALEFWKKHGTKSPVELALVFLAEGGDEQRSAAAGHLVESDEPAAHAAFEKAVLSADDPVAFASDVETYLDARKAAAKPFFTAYSKLLRTALDGVDFEKMDYSTGSYTVRQAGSVDAYLKKLGMKIGDVSLKEMAREALKADLAPGARRFHSLGEAFQSAPVAELLDLVAEIAPDADAAGRLELYQVLVWRAYREEDDDKASAPIPIAPPLAANWRKLLVDPSALAEGWFSSSGCTTHGHAAAMALELAVDPSASDSLRLLFQVLDDPAQVAPLITRRATARLDGTEIPALPDAAKVSAERIREIVAKVATFSGPEVVFYIRALNLDERAAWAAHLEKLLAEDEPALPTSLLDLRGFVTRTGGPGHDAALLEKTGISDGSSITPKSLTTLANTMLAKPEEFSGITLRLGPAPLGLGLIAHAGMRDPKSQPTRMLGFLASRFQQAPAETDAMLVIYFDQDDPFGLSLWSSTKGRTNRETVDDGPPDALDQLTEHLASTSHRPITLEISLLTRADAEKLSNR